MIPVEIRQSQSLESTMEYHWQRFHQIEIDTKWQRNDLLSKNSIESVSLEIESKLKYHGQSQKSQNLVTISGHKRKLEDKTTAICQIGQLENQIITTQSNESESLKNKIISDSI